MQPEVGLLRSVTGGDQRRKGDGATSAFQGQNFNFMDVLRGKEAKEISKKLEKIIFKKRVTFSMDFYVTDC